MFPLVGGRFPVIPGRELRRDEVRNDRPPAGCSLLPRCCERNSASFPSCDRSLAWKKHNPVEARIPLGKGGKRSFATGRGITSRQLRQKCRWPPTAGGGGRQVQTHNGRFLRSSASAGKFACVLLRASVLCGLQQRRQLRKMPLCLFHDSCW